MNGIYVHIPFCKTKCYYCDFYSVTKTNQIAGFEKVLIDELCLRQDYLVDKTLDTIYFGGGTPTLLPPPATMAILNMIGELYQVLADHEFTIEANPDDLNPEILGQFRKMGFNRISIGVQSFFNGHLSSMNRRHDADQAINSIAMAADAGFDNISLDLIYGMPGMTVSQWARNLEIAANLPVCHISAYHLTIEPGTRFGKLKKAGLFSEISEDQSLKEYLMLQKVLELNGFEQYEISNFARQGRYSRHNQKYWNGDHYLGIGPSAHSFNGKQRHWNPSNLTRYKEGIAKGKFPEGEEVNPLMKRNEFVMTHLRTAQGIGSNDFIEQFGQKSWNELIIMADKPLDKGDLLLRNGRLFFDRKAWFHSDGILSDLFLDE